MKTVIPKNVREVGLIQRGFLLASHGINRHQTALQIEKLEQFGNRRDLVGLFGRLDLAQHHTICRAEGTDHVDRPFTLPSAVQPTQRLAINGHHRALRHVEAGLHPLGKSTLELLGIHQRHHITPQGVMARHDSR